MSSIVRGAVKIADSVTQKLNLQPQVSHFAFLSEDRLTGEKTYKGVVKRRALVEDRQEQVRALDGELKMSRAYVAFLRPVAIDVNDKIVLPNGFTAPILRISGLLDPATNKGYTTEVWLG